MGTRAAAIVAALAVTGCKYGTDAFSCTDNTSCGGNGTCQPNSLCSFPDSSCPSGQRYGGLAGTSSDQCVGGGGNMLPPDAAIVDGAPDAHPDAQLCFGTGIAQLCLASLPTMAFTPPPGNTIDTTNSPMCATLTSSNGDYCVVASTNIALTTDLRATGSKPLVLLSLDSITSSGTASIDASSRRARTPETGAGADFNGCTAGTAPAVAGGGAGGGAGGSYAGAGGSGGKGNGGNANGGTPGTTASAINMLRGGCAGQVGGGENNNQGHGGGAVFLIAVNSITIAGGIFAGGEGGGGSDIARAGGGGAGSGGTIGLDAPMIKVTSALVANGGGGGAGASAGVIGGSGSDGITTSAATGGSTTSSNAGNGGPGSSGAAAGTGGTGQDANDGGGGGGGGAGLIAARTGADLGSMVSPVVTSF